MEQIIFDSSYLLRPATFFRRPFLRTRLLWPNYLFNYCNCSHPSLEVVYLFLCFMAAIHSLKYTVSFSFVVPPTVICCRSLSYVTVTRRHLFSLAAIRCHPFSYKRSSKTKCYFLGRAPVKFHDSWFFIENADHYRN